jgi:hypothetical protein
MRACNASRETYGKPANCNVAAGSIAAYGFWHTVLHLTLYGALSPVAVS